MPDKIIDRDTYRTIKKMSREELQAFLMRYAEGLKEESPTLDLRELENIESDDPMCVFGYPDAFKVRSCMTLFMHAAPEQELFQKVLDKFCQGNEDEKTLRILGI